MAFLHTHHKYLIPLAVAAALAVPSLVYAADLESIILSIVGILTYIGASMLDAALVYLVVDMGNKITNTSGLGTSINITWTIVRDLVNLTFIFGLVYVGFRTILDAESKTKQMLASIIICALLVNFSLFISKAVIDVSNVAAVEIYNAMDVSGTTQEHSTATLFLQRMGIVRLYAPNEASNFFNSFVRPEGSSFLAFVLGSSVFLLAAAFVFAAGAILIAIRFGVLILLMILSPIAFIPIVFPGVGGWASKWWRTLFSQAFFAPAYVFMLFITLKVAEGFHNAHSSMSDMFYRHTDGVQSFETGIFFVVTVVLLVAALVLAKQMGAYGAGKAVSLGRGGAAYLARTAGRGAGSATFGLVASGLQSTIGQAAYRNAQDKTLLDKAATSGIGGWAARRQLNISRALGDSSFDARRAGGIGTTLYIGEGRGGGYETRVEEAKKREAAFNRSLGTIDDDDEKVVERRGAVEYLEEEVARLKDKRSAASSEKDKIAAGEAVRAAEKKLQKARQELEQERHRRQVGSAEALSDKQDYQQAIAQEKKLKDELDRAAQALARIKQSTGANQQNIDRHRQLMHKRLENLKEQKKQTAKIRQQYLGELGYAGVVEKTGHSTWRSFAELSTPYALRNAGESIRKEYEKRAKQSKDDKHTDSIVESISKIKTGNT